MGVRGDTKGQGAKMKMSMPLVNVERKNYSITQLLNLDMMKIIMGVGGQESAQESRKGQSVDITVVTLCWSESTFHSAFCASLYGTHCCNQNEVNRGERKAARGEMDFWDILPLAKFPGSGPEREFCKLFG
jgi:hypothetical protein